MRLNWLRPTYLLITFHLILQESGAQTCRRSDINGTNINLLCNQVCSTLVFRVPHIKSTSDYALTSIPYAPYAYSTPAGSQDLLLYCDDIYGGKVTMPFGFCFYDSIFSKLVVGSNGLVTFDTTNASCGNGFITSTTIPGAGTTGQCSSVGPYYPRASIMMAYSDIDPRPIDPSASCGNANASLPSRKIEWRTEGTAPCRRFIISYFNVGTFGRPNTTPMNTFQAVLYESTGVIEYFILNRTEASTTNSGRAIMGIQDWTRTKATVHPLRNATVWGATNEGWRFTPSAGLSRYVSSQLFDMSGNLLVSADSSTSTQGLLDLSFQNVCPPAGSTQYEIVTTFSACDNPGNLLVSRDTITLNRTNSIGATQTNIAATCGNANGSITVTIPSGVGTSPFSYVLDGGVPVVTPALTHTFTGVAAGPHMVTVTDASTGCTSTLNVTVGLVGNLLATTSSTATACAAVNNNGTITITPTIGTAPFNYVIDGGAPVSGGSPYTFTGLSSGNHTITFTDVNGCTSNPIVVNIATGAGLTNHGVSSVATSCPGATNGSITVTSVTGGTAPYEYQLGAGPFQTSNTFTGLASGTYTITIRDAVGCLRTFTRTVTAGSSVTATRTLTATSCPAAADGSVTITPTSGTGPYEFSLDGGAFVAGAVPFTFSGLSAGAHNFVVRDVPTGCLSLTINFTIAAGPGINASAVPASTSCSGAANGSVTVTPVSGTGPFTYVLDGGAPVVGPSPYTFNNLTAGPHTVVVTDNSTGCASGTINFNVAVGPILTANAVPASTSCSGATNGSITVTATSGTGPYTFSLDGGAQVAGVSPYIFNNLAAGNHTVTVTDIPTGCVTNVIPVTIDAGPVITTTASKTDVLCNGGNTGTITVAQPAVGSAPFEYSLDGTNWQTSNFFSGLAAGTYTVYYRELNGCQNSLSITVTEPPTLGLLATTNPVVCNGQSNGIITASVTGGATPYGYSIDGGTNWQTSNVFNVPAGLYTVTIRDGNGCTTTQIINVTEPPVLSAVSTNTNASCDGGNDGVISVSATGGNTSYEYSIDGGTNWQSNNVFNVAPGNYTVTVRDNLGCTTSFPTTVGLTNDLTFTQQTDPVICESRSTQLNLVSNATQYVWTPSTGLSSTTINNPVASPVVTTQYIVTATLGRCSAADTVVVNVNPAPIPNAGPDGFICYGQDYQLNATGGVQYKWTPSTYLDNPDISSPLSTPTKDITYTVTILADANGCASLITDQMTIDVTPPIKIKTYPFDTVVYEMDQFQMLAVSSDPDVINFNWTPSTGLDNPAIANPIVTAGSLSGYVTGTTSNEILYQVIGSTVAGCIGEGYVKVRVYKGPDLYVPTGFTPNGDGRNDRFVPFPVGIKSLTYFRVYNRWGQMVYSTNRLHEGWDGVFSGLAQPSGSYVWMAEAITEQGKTITKKGAVTLIR